jgi:bifunctional DNase/RNase
VERVVISEVKDSVYYARLILQQTNELGRKVIELDARPSDCLALATALKRPIFVTRAVLDQVNDQSDTLERSNDWESQQE